MRISTLIGGVALGTLMAGSAVAGSVPSGVFTATLVGLSATGGGGAVSTDLYYTGPLEFNGPLGTFTVYCADLNHNVGLGGVYTFLDEPLTQNGAGTALSQQTSNEVGVIASRYEHGAGDASVAAQAAIWELLYPGTNPTFSGPDSANIQSIYDSLLYDAENGLLPNNGHYANALIPWGYTPPWPGGDGFNPPQAMVFAVPEAATWAMMLIGFAGLGFAGYRNVKAKALFSET
jgi:hypothetical protein